MTLTLKLIIATTALIALSAAASAECRLYGTKYAPGAATRDLSGTRIYCNTYGNWQSTRPVPGRRLYAYDEFGNWVQVPPPLGTAAYYRYLATPRVYYNYPRPRRGTNQRR